LFPSSEKKGESLFFRKGIYPLGWESVLRKGRSILVFVGATGEKGFKILLGWGSDPNFREIFMPRGEQKKRGFGGKDRDQYRGKRK